MTHEWQGIPYKLPQIENNATAYVLGAALFLSLIIGVVLTSLYVDGAKQKAYREGMGHGRIKGSKKWE